MLTSKSHAFIVAFGLLLSLNAQALETDEWTGTVDHVSLKDSELIVDDLVFKLTIGYKVLNPNNKPVSAFNLQKGKRVRVIYETGTGKLIRVEIMK